MSTTSSLVKHDMRHRIPLYVASFCAGAVGLAALNSMTADTGFTLLAFVLLAAGFIISWMVRAAGLTGSSSLCTFLIVIGCVLATILAVPAIEREVFSYSTKPADANLAALLVALMVAYSFNLTTDAAVLFLCVPALSLIGLVATFNPSFATLVYFLAFIGLASFILIQQNVLSRRKRSVVATSSLTMHTKLTVGITLTALVLGMVFGKLLYATYDKTVPPSLLGGIGTGDIDRFMARDYVEIATGPVSLSEQEVMMVTCQSPLLWRGQTFDTYMEHSWSNSRLLFKEGYGGYGGWGNGTLVIDPPPWMKDREAVEPVMQTFEIVSCRYEVVFAAAEPESIRFSMPLALRVSDGTIRAGSSYGMDTPYTALSLVSTAGPRELRRAPHGSDDYPEEIKARYISTPESCQAVEKLARRLVKGHNNPYDKAIAIQHYLETTYPYDANAPAVPSSEDAVAYFLFKSRRGYCDLFSSAMVIMSRQVGIPARWVTGFASGEFDPNDGKYHVRLKDQHAWAELYFPGYGWIAFDPAPLDRRATLMDRMRISMASIGGILKSINRTIPVAMLLVLLVGYLVWVEVIDRVWGRRHGRVVPQDTSLTLMSQSYRRMCDLLSNFGYPRGSAVTPSEYAAELAGLFRLSLEHLSASVESITTDFIAAKYAARDLPADRVTAAQAAVARLLRDLKDARKRKLLPRSMR